MAPSPSFDPECPEDEEPSAGFDDEQSGGWWTPKRVVLGGVLLAIPLAVIAVDVTVIARSLSSSGSVQPEPTPEPSQAAAVAVPSADPGQDDTSTAPPLAARTEDDPLDWSEDEPAQPKPRKPGPPRDPKRAAASVEDASARTCSTSIVDGLSRQIIAQARCIDATAFVAVPRRANLVVDDNVFLHLDATAKDRLLEVLDANKGRTMHVHSALRTVAQQYLLHRWSKTKRCGIQLATPPGESNHESGLALDISEPGLWRTALESKGFKWLGRNDPVHFDYKAGTAHNRIDVLAFQRLWNRNHPEDPIAETGSYDAATEARLRKAPPAGFPTGAQCGRAAAGATAAGGRASGR